MEAWIVAALIAAGAVYSWHRWRRLARAEFIRAYTFPHGLFAKLNAKRPQLDAKQMQLVARALRQFFLAYLHSGRQYVSMPSQVTDDLWHEFILYTRHYDAFCRRAFGGFLHHTPGSGADSRSPEQLRPAASVVVQLLGREHQSAQSDAPATAVCARFETRYRRRLRLQTRLQEGPPLR